MLKNLLYFIILCTISINTSITNVAYATTPSSTISSGEYHLGIRDSLMIAHSFHNNPSFGPAGGLHGATYTCDVEFGGTSILHPECNWVIDIGLASDILSNVLKKYNYQNLDAIFGPTILTTTEFMCRQIHQDITEQLQILYPNFTGTICVKLWESHKAWAKYTARI
jgi:6-pyruvoyltetrahydropterin/6-carboxytetrahydropterin synthase